MTDSTDSTDVRRTSYEIALLRGGPLFLLDPTGAPQPVNDPARAQDATRT